MNVATVDRATYWCTAGLLALAAVLAFVVAILVGVEGQAWYWWVLLVLFGLLLCVGAGSCCLMAPPAALRRRMRNATSKQ